MSWVARELCLVSRRVSGPPFTFLIDRLDRGLFLVIKEWLEDLDTRVSSFLFGEGLCLSALVVADLATISTASPRVAFCVPWTVARSLRDKCCRTCLTFLVSSYYSGAPGRRRQVRMSRSPLRHWPLFRNREGEAPRRADLPRPSYVRVG